MIWLWLAVNRAFELWFFYFGFATRRIEEPELPLPEAV